MKNIPNKRAKNQRKACFSGFFRAGVPSAKPEVRIICERDATERQFFLLSKESRRKGVSDHVPGPAPTGVGRSAAGADGHAGEHRVLGVLARGATFLLHDVGHAGCYRLGCVLEVQRQRGTSDVQVADGGVADEAEGDTDLFSRRVAECAEVSLSGFLS